MNKLLIYLTISTIFTLIALFLMAIREGIVIKDLIDGRPSPKESDQWHLVGFFVRGLMILSVIPGFIKLGFVWLTVIFVSIAFLLSSVWYNVAINIINGWKWNRLGGGKIDTFLKKLLK